MQTAEQPSTFAQIVDKLRSKNEAELKLLYTQFFVNDLKKEWKDITDKSDFANVSESDIIKAIQEKRYPK